MFRSPIIIYSILFITVSSSILRNIDHDECKRIPNCDECDDGICTECDDGFYLSSPTRCERCSQRNCESCPNDVCTKCHDHNILIGNACQSYDMIPIEKRMKECEHYDLDFSCLKCDSDCSMRNGVCLCDKDDDDDDDDDNHTAAIVISIVVAVAVLAGLIIGGRFLYLYMKKRKPTEERNVNIGLPTIPVSDEVNYDIMNEKGVKQSNTVGDDDLIESKTIEVKKTISKRNTLHLCTKCNKETALYQLSCGCYLCKEDINEEGKCPVCGETVGRVKTILHECGICMEIKEKANRFDCGCKFEICDGCGDKILKSGQCPGCRKEIRNIIAIKE